MKRNVLIRIGWPSEYGRIKDVPTQKLNESYCIIFIEQGEPTEAFLVDDLKNLGEMTTRWMMGEDCKNFLHLIKSN